MRHVQFEDVASQIKGMEDLFDLGKPYFAAWCQSYDIDIGHCDSVFFQFTGSKSGAKPLYYTALCGFKDLVEQLIVKHPEHVNAISGYYVTPAMAALAQRHFKLAQVLHCNGSSMDLWSLSQLLPLHCATRSWDLEMVQVLLNYGVDVNARSVSGYTPLDWALRDRLKGADPRIVQSLLDHGLDPNLQANDGLTPLYRASQGGKVEIVHLLVERSASVEVRDRQGKTPLDVASGEHRDEIIKLLLEHCDK